MFKTRTFVYSFLSTISLFFFASSVFAGGGPVEFTIVPNSSLNPGEQYVVNARVYADGPYPTYCKNCSIQLVFEDSQEGDYIAQNSDKTDNDGRIYAKVISKVPGSRTLIVKDRKIVDASGKEVTANSYAILRYYGNTPTPTPIATTPTPAYSYAAPTMVYPQNGQTLDFEGSYNVKVNLVPGASGYLFGFFQDGKAVFENYSHLRTLSTNGEFSLTENMPGRANFKPGSMDIWARALINNQWTDARITTVTLKPRVGGWVNPTQRPIPTTAPNTYFPTSLTLKMSGQTLFDSAKGKFRRVTFEWNGNPGEDVRYILYARDGSDAPKGEAGWITRDDRLTGPTGMMELAAWLDWYVRVDACHVSRPNDCISSPSILVRKVSNENASTSPQPIYNSGNQGMSSEAAQLQQKVNDLQRQLQESQQRQSVLEKQLNQIMNWIRSFFPFFK